MEKTSLQKKLKELGNWYQKINLDGIVTTSKGPYSNVEKSSVVWNKINSLISNDYKSLRVLDLGCNAGYYSIMSAKEGASVIGVESSTKYFTQALFLKEYYEKLLNTKLDITYIQKDISDIDFSKMKKFDYIFALSIFYHIGKHKYGKGTPEKNAEQIRMISYFANITNNFIVRARKGKNRDLTFYNSILNPLGFKTMKVIPEGKRTMILYSKEKIKK